jgi:glycolate oxidase
MNVYTKITPETVRQLAQIVGGDNVLIDPEALEAYSQDETEDLRFSPDVVLKPTSSLQIADVMRVAEKENIPVTPRAGGTGLSGGALPVFGGIVLSLEKLNRILNIDTQNLQAVVEPGVITQKFQEEVEALGLYYPPDPASRGSSHLGGNLAECAGGPHAVKYGVTKDYILGLEAVCPNGEIIRTGGPVLKNVSGYNLTQLLIGSEGTLAIITKIILRLIPLPRHRKVMLVAFPTLEAAARAVAGIFQRGVTPSACEFIERAAVEATERHTGKVFPNSGAAAQLVIEVDGTHEPTLDEEIQTVAAAVEEHGATAILLAEDRQKIQDVWDLRQSIGESVKSISAYKEEDTVVPRSRLPELVEGVKAICREYGITSICYGHAGDGNVHVNILKAELDEETWNHSVEAAVHKIFELTVSLGGTISGEHGIGYSQKGYLPIAIGPAELAIMKAIKGVFDPRGILNPGKIFL